MQAENLASLPGHATAVAPSRAQSNRFATFASVLLGYLLFVIVFGAWVRITGSGAGCGDHWPTCHGELVPRAPSTQTVIEYTHRLTSGSLGILALALPVWAFRIFPRRHPARRFALATLLLVIVEAGIGAGLVLRQLVALDASRARAIVVAVHLANTLLLTASSVLSVAYARGPRARAAAREDAPRGNAGLWLWGLLAGLMLVAASGAVTALGDTLFPVSSSDGRVPDPDHFLVQLRVVHPLLACLAVGLALALCPRFAREPRCRPWAIALGAAAGIQLVLGLVNIALAAPGWLQLLHLLGAQLTWLCGVLLAWSWYAAPVPAEPAAAR